MNKWFNKVAVITGAGAGIGTACTKALIQHGMIIVGLDKSQENLEKLRDLWPNDEEKQQRLHVHKCDVRQEKDVIQTFEKIAQVYGHIAVLINNAGIARDTPMIQENNTKDLLDTIETNIIGTAYCTREAFKIMAKNNNNYGHVIIMNSIAGHRIPTFKGLTPNIYPPTKYAQTAMAEVYRHEFKLNNRSIKVTNISPGIVKTNIYPKTAWELVKDTPLLKASDIADAVVYCLQTPSHVEIHELIIMPFSEKL